MYDLPNEWLNDFSCVTLSCIIYRTSIAMSKSIKSYLTFEIDYLPDKINFRSKKQEKKP